MATLFFAKDGFRPKDDETGPYTQSGSGIEMSGAEALAVMGNGPCIYHGTEEPSIHPGPVRGPERNVVIKIEQSDIAGAFFQAGFYHLPALTPAQARHRLANTRGAV